MSKYQDLAKDIVKATDPYGILAADVCMTRFRIKLKKQADVEELKKIPQVLGVVHQNGSDEYQLVLGPGVVNKVYAEFKKLKDVSALETACEVPDKNESLKDVAARVKSENQAQRQQNFVAIALSKFAKVFAPLIPAFIGAGLFAAIAGIIQASCQNDFDGKVLLQQWYNFFSIVNTVWLQVFLVIFGYRFCEGFGGRGWIGAIIGALFMSNVWTNSLWAGLYNTTTQTLLGIPIPRETLWYNWLTSGLVSLSSDGNHALDSIASPHGSMFGIIIGCVGVIYFERLIQKVMPSVIDPIATPLVVILAFMIVDFILIIPVSGYIFLAVSEAFKALSTGPGAPFGDMILAGIFLICVMFGIHQGFVPVYVSLMSSIGINTLFPVLALAGASQVGVAIAMFFIAEKGGVLRKQIASAIVPGFLGIGEPLIYGVSLPRVVPLICACVGAMVPGFFIGAFNAWGGIDVGLNATFGPSGILAIAMITSHATPSWWGYVIYLIALLIAYASGALVMFAGYKLFKNNKKVNWNLG